MADSDIDVGTLKAGHPMTVGAVTLLPVERTVVRASGQGARAWVFGSRDLYALVLRDAEGIRAVDANAAAIPLEQLVGAIPGLGAALSAIDPDFERRWSG